MEALRGEKRKSPTIHARRLEVFSARLAGLNPRVYQRYFGLIFLRSCDHDCVIFESSVLEPPLIDSEGHISLTGPKWSIPVKDEIIICPRFIDGRMSRMNIDETILWQAEVDDFSKCIYRKISVMSISSLEIQFAVYNDAVEAHLDFCLVGVERGDVDEPILIRGTVSCSNSFVSDSEAKSFLFDKVSGVYVFLKPDEPIMLPLLRKMVVVPRDSTLHVDVRLAIGSKPEDASIAENLVKFDVQSDIVERFVIIPNCGKLSVKVTWVECKDHV